MTCITGSGLMTQTQYQHAETELIRRLTSMREREGGHVTSVVSSGDEVEDPLDDPVEKSLSTFREKALDEFRTYCNVVKKRRYVPKAYAGETLRIGSIQMGKVAMKGDDIKASHPFVTCNLSDYIRDDGRFDLVSFLELQKDCFPTLFKLAVCLASIRTNEVGCEHFFSTAGFVSCPRRTSLKVRNYECLATLKANIQTVYIDEEWVVDRYLIMEKKKGSWLALDTGNDLEVLELEREMQAESLGVSADTLPPIDDEVEPEPEPEVIELTT
jgi:hAT family C-terminal dimerisation region